MKKGVEVEISPHFEVVFQPVRAQKVIFHFVICRSSDCDEFPSLVADRVQPGRHEQVLAQHRNGQVSISSLKSKRAQVTS